MTTFNLRVDPNGDTKNKQAEERVDTLIGGKPKLHIRAYANKEQETTMLDVDFTPENKAIRSGGATRGAMRGVR